MNRELVWRLLWGALGPALLELLGVLALLTLIAVVMLLRRKGYVEATEAVRMWWERNGDTLRLVAAVASGMVLAALLLFVAIKVFMFGS